MYVIAYYISHHSLIRLLNLKLQLPLFVSEFDFHQVLIWGSLQRDVESTTEGSKGKDGNGDQSAWEVIGSDLFEENFRELKKWVNVKSSKYGTLLVIRERRCGRPGAALKVILI